jgi:polysaccharide pyruvyl transferase WcaK-like protein
LKPKQIIIIGASFGTGNLGVNALAWASIKIIVAKWPSSKIVIVGAGRHPAATSIRLNSRQEKMLTWPVRYCVNLLAHHHIAKLLVSVSLCRFLPSLRKRLTESHSTLGELLRSDLVCDISGGDSFSDIYGLPRFLRGYLLKRVCQITGKPFILLPQTYGPFKSPVARILARQILNNSQTIYSRDQEGIAVVEKLIGPLPKIRLCPDVAFIMDPIRPETAQTSQLEQLKRKGKRIVGLNISGLLYHGGYTRDNMFGLAGEYTTLVRDIISYFASQADQYVLLVPHVLPSADFAVEDDSIAANKALVDLPADLQDRVIALERGYDQNETKYFIGLCDFFLGARMHATIAALSQCIPAVGLAYSRKFSGVFETAGVADCVLDLRSLNNDQVLVGIQKIFARSEKIRTTLEQTIPSLKSQVFSMFDRLPEAAGKG